jgi:tripartite-type tricarboxylate transporter receptor subunit TctC
VPTIAEQGLPGFDVTAWFAIFAPAGTPKEIVVRLNAEALRLYKLPDIQEKLKTLGLDPVLSTPDELGRVQESEVVKWARVVKESGAKAE